MKLISTGRLKEIYTLINCYKSQRYFVYRYIRSYLKNSEITDYLAFMSEYFKKDKALNLKSRDFQDSVALYFSRNRVDNFFVELGAGDGVIRSNTYALEHEGWNGISVEPNSFLHNDFIQIRKTECLPVALVNVENDYLLCFDSDPYLGRLVSKIDLNGSKFENALPIRCMLASEFLNRIPEKIDYLSIDIEGMDFEILETFLESSK